MKTNSMPNAGADPAKPAGLFGASHRDLQLQRPAWPFRVQSNKPAACAPVSRDGPSFKS